MTDTWTLEATAARLSAGPLQARVGLERPEAGLSALLLNGRPLVGAQLLGVELAATKDAPSKASEAYCRGGDLVVSYAHLQSRPTAVQLYWRVNQSAVNLAAGGALAEIDLEVSVQTPLLDSDPALWTCSRLPEGVLLHSTGNQPADFQEIGRKVSELEIQSDNLLEPPAFPSCWLVRPAGLDVSYAEMVHPADFWLSRLERTESSGDRLLRHWLFVSRLEKGVILRARVRGVLLTREGDCEQAAAAYRRFAESPPPLTT